MRRPAPPPWRPLPLGRHEADLPRAELLSHVSAAVMSGGGGSGLCSHLRGICTAGAGRPEDRGALFHAVELSLAGTGDVSGRVLQAFAGPGESRIVFPAPRS